MKKLIPFLLLILLGQCHNDFDIVANYKNGAITRAQLRKFYEIYGLGKNAESKTIEYQSSVINELAMQNIVYQNFNDIAQTDQDNLFQVTNQQFLISLYRKRFLDLLEQQAKLELAEIQLLVIRDTEKLNPQNTLAKLNKMSNDEIDKFIAENTEENSRKSVSGYLEPVCTNCGQDPVVGLIENGLKSNNRDFNYIDSSSNHYLYRVLTVRKVKLADLENYFSARFSEMNKMALQYLKSHTDDTAKQEASYYSGEQFKNAYKNTSEHYKKKYINQAWMDHFNTIKADSKIVINEELDHSRLNDQSVLYTDKDGKEFRFSDLENEYKKVSILINNQQQNNLQNDKLNYFYQFYIPYKIVSASENFQDVLHSDTYKSGIDLIKKSVVWRFKQKTLGDNKIVIAEKEIQDTYQAGKMYAYSRPDPANPSKRIALPYHEVRENIKKELEQNKKNQLVQGFIQNVQSQYEIKINTKALVAGKL